MPGLAAPFITFTLLYIVLSVILVFLTRRQFLETAPRPQETAREKEARYAGV